MSTTLGCGGRLSPCSTYDSIGSGTRLLAQEVDIDVGLRVDVLVIRVGVVIEASILGRLSRVGVASISKST